MVYIINICPRLGDIQLIKRLSEGVKNINEHKVSIYHKDQDDFDSIMNSTKAIEYSLIEKLTSHFGISYWDECASNFLLIKRLMREIREYKQTGTSVVFNALERLTINNHSVPSSNSEAQELILIGERYLEKSKFLMVIGINKIPYKIHQLEKRMIVMVQNHVSIGKIVCGRRVIKCSKQKRKRFIMSLRQFQIIMIK